MTPDQLALFNALTPLQREVCTRVVSGMAQREAYMAAKAASGRPCSAAAADASASRMLGMAKPAAFLEAMRAAAVTKAVMDKREAMELLTRISRTSLSDLVEWARYPIETDEETGEVVSWQTGWRIKDHVEQDPEKMALIAELNAGKEGLKIKTHSPLQALQLLGKFAGWEAPAKVAQTNSAGEDVPLPSVIRLVGPDGV